MASKTPLKRRENFRLKPVLRQNAPEYRLQAEAPPGLQPRRTPADAIVRMAEDPEDGCAACEEGARGECDTATDNPAEAGLGEKPDIPCLASIELPEFPRFSARPWRIALLLALIRALSLRVARTAQPPQDPETEEPGS